MVACIGNASNFKSVVLVCTHLFLKKYNCHVEQTNINKRSKTINTNDLLFLSITALNGVRVPYKHCYVHLHSQLTVTHSSQEFC